MKKIRNRKDLQITDLLIAHGPAGYGVYVMLTQYLGERKSLRRRQDIARIAYELHAPAEMVRSVLEDFGLFECVGDEFFNESAPAKQPKEPAQELAKPEPAETAVPAKETNESYNSYKSYKSYKAHKPHDGQRKILVKQLLKHRRAAT